MTETHQGFSDRIIENHFEACFKDGDDVYIKWEVIPIDVKDLCSEWIALGLARKIQMAGYDAYIVFNPKDLGVADIEDISDYDV